MARSLNRVTLIGNVGDDPAITSTKNGSNIARISLATNRQWKDASGNQQERTDWHRIVFFGKLADIVQEWVRKGDKLYVDGRVEYSQVDKDDGTKAYYTDIVAENLIMLSSGDRDAPRGQSRPAQQPAAPARPKGNTDPDDELPF